LLRPRQRGQLVRLRIGRTTATGRPRTCGRGAAPGGRSTHGGTRSLCRRGDFAEAVSDLGHPQVDHRLAIRVHRREEQIGFTIAVTGERYGERLIDTAGMPCDELTRTLAVTLAVVLDTVEERLSTEARGEARGAESVPEPSKAPKPPPPPRPVCPPPPPAPPCPAPESWLRISAEAESGIAVGLFPRENGMASAFLGYGLPAGISLRAGIVRALPRAVALGSGEVQLDLLGGRLDGCYGVAGRWLGYRACLGAVAGRFGGRGDGLRPIARSISPGAAW